MKNKNGTHVQCTIIPMPEDPEDFRTDTQLMDQLTTDYFREHSATIRGLCESMGLTFVESSGATIERPANNRNRPFGKIPFIGQHSDGRKEEFQLLTTIKRQ